MGIVRRWTQTRQKTAQLTLGVGDKIAGFPCDRRAEGRTVTRRRAAPHGSSGRGGRHVRGEARCPPSRDVFHESRQWSMCQQRHDTSQWHFHERSSTDKLLSFATLAPHEPHKGDEKLKTSHT